MHPIVDETHSMHFEYLLPLKIPDCLCRIAELCLKWHSVGSKKPLDSSS